MLGDFAYDCITIAEQHWDKIKLIGIIMVAIYVINGYGSAYIVPFIEPYIPHVTIVTHHDPTPVPGMGNNTTTPSPSATTIPEASPPAYPAPGPTPWPPAITNGSPMIINGSGAGLTLPSPQPTAPVASQDNPALVEHVTPLKQNDMHKVIYHDPVITPGDHLAIDNSNCYLGSPWYYTGDVATFKVAVINYNTTPFKPVHYLKLGVTVERNILGVYVPVPVPVQIPEVRVDLEQPLSKYQRSFGFVVPTSQDLGIDPTGQWRITITVYADGVPDCQVIREVTIL